MSAKNPSNRISEILKGLAQKYLAPSPSQSSKDISPLRKKSLMIFQKLEVLSDKYVKHKAMKELVMKFVRPHITNVIEKEIPEAELKNVMREIFIMLKEDFEDFEIATALNETKLNPKLNEKLKKLPAYREIADLL